MSAIEKEGLDSLGSSRKPKIRVNGGIRSPMVRLIGSNANMIGVVSLQEALDRASREKLDLVEVSPGSDPPVCKILNYGKFKYETQKKMSQMKKNQKSVVIKEVKIRPCIDEGDYQVKLKWMFGFIASGFKVRVILRLRGREIVHKDKSMELMHRIANDLSEVAGLDGGYGGEGHSIVMLIAPKVAKAVQPNITNPVPDIEEE